MILSTRAKKKKSHYTVRRAPGKISHLLITNRLNSFSEPTNNHHHQHHQQQSATTDSPRLRLKASDLPTTAGDTVEFKFARNDSVSKKMFLPTYDISIYIDDDNFDEEEEEEEEDCFTATNATTMTNLTTANNNNLHSKKTSSENNIDNHLLSANYLSVSSIRNDNNTNSSQNMTECDANSDGEMFFKPNDGLLGTASIKGDSGASLNDTDCIDFAKNTTTVTDDYDQFPTHIV